MPLTLWVENEFIHILVNNEHICCRISAKLEKIEKVISFHKKSGELIFLAKYTCSTVLVEDFLDLKDIFKSLNYSIKEFYSKITEVRLK